jgi:hypothetical protein
MGTITALAGLTVLGLQGLAADVRKTPFPARPVSGVVFGERFQCTKAVLYYAGSSSTRSEGLGSDGVAFYHVDFHDEVTGGRRRDVQIRIAVDLDQSLEGKSIAWQPVADDTPEDRVQKTLMTDRVRIARGIRWISVDTFPVGGGYASSIDFREKFSVRLALGHAKNGMIPGKVVLSIPDEHRSWVAGSFVAEYRPRSR